MHLFRQYERYHYLCSLLQNQSQQPAYTILRAFNIELSRARTSLSQTNPSIAAGKFTFWREVIENENKVIEHPVAESLQWLLKKHQLDKQALLEIVDAKVLQMAV